MITAVVNLIIESLRNKTRNGNVVVVRIFRYDIQAGNLKIWRKNLSTMPRLRNVRNSLLLAFNSSVINAEELLLLNDINSSKNPDFLYWSYKNFDFNNMSDDECKSEFRFLRNDIDRLINVCQLPREFLCYNGLRVFSVEALCIFLKRFVYPCRQLDVMSCFARPVPT